MSTHLAAIRRYPVKSMGGEALQDVVIDERGLQGDRRFAVRDGDGRLASGKSTQRFRRRDEIFDHHVHTAADGMVVVATKSSRWDVDDPALDAHLAATMDADVAVVAEDTGSHQDGGAVSLVGTASLQWCAERWGIDADPRRLRVNLVVATTQPFVEETWIGDGIRVGAVELQVATAVPRCRMIDIAQDGVAPSDGWLRRLATERDGCIAVYADVIRDGRVVCGDPVEGGGVTTAGVAVGRPCGTGSIYAW